MSIFVKFLLMHELSIAINIIDIASEQAKKNNLSVIDEIEIEVGTLSGVEIDALKFALEIATKNTIIENSKTTITEIIGQARCMTCLKEFVIDRFFTQCPECEQFNFEIIKGQELRVKSMSVY